MQTSITLRAIDLMPGLGGDSAVPFRWLETLVQKVRATVPDIEEASCFVYGAEDLSFCYDHALSETEQLQSTISELVERAAQIKAMLPIEGALSAAQTDALRKLIG